MPQSSAPGAARLLLWGLCFSLVGLADVVLGPAPALALSFLHTSRSFPVFLYLVTGLASLARGLPWLRWSRGVSCCRLLSRTFLVPLWPHPSVAGVLGACLLDPPLSVAFVMGSFSRCASPQSPGCEGDGFLCSTPLSAWDLQYIALCLPFFCRCLR